MAFIGTLRDKMGKWVVAFVVIAILAFIGNDFLSGGNSVLLNMGKNSIGSIAGHQISREEYSTTIENIIADYRMRTNRDPNQNEMAGLQQQAWDLLIARYAIEGQYEELGLEVSDDEVNEITRGKFIDPNVQQVPVFQNPQTGQFDPNLVNEFFTRTQASGSEEEKMQLNYFLQQIKSSRARLKYENLLLKSIYATRYEAELDYHLQTDVAEAKYLYIPYYTADTLAKPTDADFSAYYNKNKNRFKTEESISLKYVTFDVSPSASDTADVKAQFENDLATLKAGSNDSTYVTSINEGRFETYNQSTLPEFIPADSLVEGKTFGPILANGKLVVVKVSAIFNDTVYAARASNIVIQPQGTTDIDKAAAKTKAAGILKEIKEGADFAVKAREHNTDQTRNTGGDLGWFQTGDMVKPFQDAVFGATKPGLINELVESDYGYHIIKVTNVKTNKAYKLALVEREIAPSDETLFNINAAAEDFKIEAEDNGFEEAARKRGLLIMEAKNLLAGDRNVSSLGQARELVVWGFNEASKGDINKLDINGTKVVAILSAKVDAGYKPLNDVKTEITPAVKNELIAKLLIEKLTPLKGTLEEIAQAYGTDAAVYASSNITLSQNTLPQLAGYEPRAVGVAFSLQNGQRSLPFAGETGVIIVELQNKTIAPEINNYQANKQSLESGLLNRSINGLAEAVKVHSNIKDYRYRYN